MDDVAAMRGLKSRGNLDCEAQRLFSRFAAARRLAFHVLEHQIIGSDVVDLADVGMVQSGDGPGFALEVLAVRAVEKLDGDRAIETGVARLPDLAHAAG